MLNEANTLRELNHPTIIQYVGYSGKGFENKPAILTAYGENGTLHDAIEKMQNPIKENEWEATKIINIYGIAMGMSYLHKQNIVHRNLNPLNIYEDENFYPLISGFEYSVNLGENKQFSDNRIVGLVMYIAPEVIKKQIYSKKSDVFAFGMIAYEILTGQVPFKGVPPQEVGKKITEGHRPEFDPKFPIIYKRMIERCWSQEIEKRPTFEDILNDYFDDDTYNKDFIIYVKSKLAQGGPKKPAEQYEEVDVKSDKKEINKKLSKSGKKKKTIQIQSNSSQKEINKKSLRKVEKIRENKYYEEYKVEDKSTGKFYSAKYFYQNIEDYPKEQQERIRILKDNQKINHPSIVKNIQLLERGFDKEACTNVLSEFQQLKSLEEINKNELTSTQKHIIAYGIASAMSYLHKHSILHSS